MKQTIKNILSLFLISAAVFFCLKYPYDISTAVSNGLDRCIDVMIPSMFVFMCITSFTVSCGLHRILSVPLTPFARYVLRLTPEQFGIFLLSIFSGYPTGIKLLKDSLSENEISKKDFDRLSCFCFAGGPAFISGTVSGVLFPGTSAGMLCFLSITTGNLICAFITGLFSPVPQKSSCRIRTRITSGIFTQSVLSSGRAMFSMCVMIVLFSGLLKAMQLSGILDIISAENGTSGLIYSLLEISNIAELRNPKIQLLPIITFLLSFGGICVLIQIIAVSDGLLNIRRFLFFRLVSAGFSAIVCRLISRFFYLGTTDAAVYGTVKVSRRPLCAVMIFAMTIMLLSSAEIHLRQHRTNHD